eukprot:gene3809-7579_t
MIMKILVLILNFVAVKSLYENFTLHFLTKYIQNNAVCIDGSPGAYLFQSGFGLGQNKWFISFEGGGWCYSNEDCFKRSQTNLGSSKAYVPEPVEENLNYFSRNSSNNFMFNWNMIFIKYCDGASFTGDTQVKYKDTILHYRGNRILSAFITELRDLGAYNATDMVISGLSAGGLAAVIHIDKFKENFPHTLVVGLPDSGFFFPYENKKCDHPYMSSMQNIYELMNSSAGIHPDCKSAGLNGNCLFATHVIRFVSSPIFILQPKFDPWHIDYILCTNKRKYFPAITAYANEFETHFHQSFKRAKNVYTSGFLDNCPHHVSLDINYLYGNDYWNKILDSNKKSQQMLFFNWMGHIRLRKQHSCIDIENDTEDTNHNRHGVAEDKKKEQEGGAVSFCVTDMGGAHEPSAGGEGSHHKTQRKRFYHTQPWDTYTPYPDYRACGGLYSYPMN